jgi:hypothetical protein
MTFEQLNYGDVFYIDGSPFQCYHKHGRIVSCIYLEEGLDHVEDSADSSGFGLKTTVFSDLRVNRNNATPAECINYLSTLRILNHV